MFIICLFSIFIFFILKWHFGIVNHNKRIDSSRMYDDWYKEYAEEVTKDSKVKILNLLLQDEDDNYPQYENTPTIWIKFSFKQKDEYIHIVSIHELETNEDISLEGFKNYFNDDPIRIIKDLSQPIVVDYYYSE